MLSVVYRQAPNGTYYGLHNNGEVFRLQNNQRIKLDMYVSAIALTKDNTFYDLHTNGDVYRNQVGRPP